MNIKLDRESARAIIELTAHPKWAVLQTLYNERQSRLYERLETENEPRNIYRDQGRTDEIRKLLELREKAEAFLSSV